jgi:hypothetical protein
MYRKWAQLREGWTKNLALLFPHPGRLALESLFWWLVAWSALVVAVDGVASRYFGRIIFAAPWLLLYRRIRTAHFSATNNLIAIAFGPSMFAYLLLLSKRAHALGRVFWKDRSYRVDARRGVPAEVKSLDLIPGIESQKLRTGN